MISSMLLALSLLTPVSLVQPREILGSHVLWMVDSSEAMTPEDALQHFAAGEGNRPSWQSLNLGLLNKPVYVIVPLENKSNETSFIIDLAYPLVDYFDLYQLKGEQLQKIGESGDRRPYANRYEKHRTPNFHLTLAPGERTLLLAKAWGGSSIQLPLYAYFEKTYRQHIVTENRIFGIYIGMFCIMILFSALLAIVLREKLYVFYVLYLCMYLAVQLQLNGLFFELFLPDQPDLTNILLPVTYFFAFTMGQIFAYQLLDLPNTVPRLAQLFRYLTVFSTFMGLISPVLSYSHAVHAAALYSGIAPTIFLLSGIKVARIGNRTGMYFAWAWSFFVFGMIIYGLKTLGYLPNHILTEYAVQVGSVLEISLLSLALANRIQSLREQRDTETLRREKLEAENDVLALEIKQGGEQLIQADKMVMLGQTVAGVAHDIADPSQLIKLAADEALAGKSGFEQTINVLFKGVTDPSAMIVRERIKRDADRVGSALHDILTANERIKEVQKAIRNQSRTDLEASDVHLRELIGECLTILRSKLKKWNLAIQCPETTLVHCRRSQLGQVLTNLLSNASDAMQEHGVVSQEMATDILVKVVEEPGQLVIIVEDNGPGIPIAIRERIFQAFYTTKSLGHGTGLGLSICKRIIDDHGGSITIIEPRQLHGAAFQVILPQDSQVIKSH